MNYVPANIRSIRILLKQGPLTQAEFVQLRFIEDPTCAGLYCQRVPEGFLDRLEREIRKRRDRREAAARVLTFDDKLTDHSSDAAMMRTHRRSVVRGRARKPSNMIWTDEVPDEPFTEYCDRPRRLITPEEAAQYGL